MMSSPKTNEIKIVPTEEQFYTRAETQNLITKPMRGSLLLINRKKGYNLICKSTWLSDEQNSDKTDRVLAVRSTGELFVVVNVDYKSRGVNKGIVDSCALNKVISISNDNFAIYDPSTISMYLFLTNHGKWFGTEQLKGNDYIWDPVISNKKLDNETDITTEDNFRRSSPIRIKSVVSRKPNSSGRNSEPSNFVHDGGGFSKDSTKDITFGLSRESEPDLSDSRDNPNKIDTIDLKSDIDQINPGT